MSAIDDLMPLSAHFEDRVRYASLNEKDTKFLIKKMPAPLFKLLKEEGLFSFQNGMFWFVDPVEMRDLKNGWDLDDDNHVFMRSAFGDFFMMRNEYVTQMWVNGGMIRSHGKWEVFFNSRLNTETSYGNLVADAKTKLGELAPDECYGFIESLMTGGKAEVDNLQKEKLYAYADRMAKLVEQLDAKDEVPEEEDEQENAYVDNTASIPVKGPFTDFNFKLSVISALHENGHYVEEVERIKEGSDFDESYVPIPEVSEYYRNLEIPQELLNEITAICPDGGDLAYQYITVEWDGEDEQFDISSIEGIDRLTNLKDFDPIAVICTDGLDFTPILACPNLKHVAMEDWESDDEANDDVRQQLRKRGVKVS